MFITITVTEEARTTKLAASFGRILYLVRNPGTLSLSRLWKTLICPGTTSAFDDAFSGSSWGSSSSTRCLAARIRW